MDGKELITALKLIEKEKGINQEMIFEAIETSLLTACKKHYGTSQNIKVNIDRETGDIKLYAQKEVVEDEYDGFLEISIEDARKINPAYELGDVIDFELKLDDISRISAQTAKQVVVQKFREAEREKVFNEFSQKKREIDTGIIQKVDKRNVIVSLGKTDAFLPLSEQIPGEEYAFNERIKVYILDVRETTKGPQVTVSRTHYELVKRLFELEVPEVHDGTVEIKNIAREAGSRTKMAVYSKNSDVDPVGACVGTNGSRVAVIVNELNGEKIDIVPWDEDPAKFISAALNPATVIAVEIDENEEEKTARVVVPDNQLSLAIGKEGQNVRLAARLTGWKVDIKSESQARLTNFVNFDAVDNAMTEDEE